MLYTIYNFIKWYLIILSYINIWMEFRKRQVSDFIVDWYITIF